MLRFLLSVIAVILYVAMFATIAWFFDAPSALRGVTTLALWLVTLGSLHLAGRQPHRIQQVPSSPRP